MYSPGLLQNIATQIRKVSDDWYLINYTFASGRRAGFFAGPDREQVAKRCAVWAAQASYRDRHGIDVGDQVIYHRRRIATSGVICFEAEQSPRRVVRVGYQWDGLPVLWLEGIAGCVPIHQAMPVCELDQEQVAA